MKITIVSTLLICKQSTSTSICQYCIDDLILFDLQRYQHNLMYSPKVSLGLAKVDFPSVMALADYQWPISKLLTGLKFSKMCPNAHALGDHFCEALFKLYT